MKIVNKLVFAFLLLLNFKAFCQPTSFESRGIGGGGALFSPAINPADNNELFMACDMSEIYHSKNKGASWNMLHFKTIQGMFESLGYKLKKLDRVVYAGLDKGGLRRGKWRFLKFNEVQMVLNTIKYHDEKTVN